MAIGLVSFEAGLSSPVLTSAEPVPIRQAPALSESPRALTSCAIQAGDAPREVDTRR
jgi:hypothetical protein